MREPKITQADQAGEDFDGTFIRFRMEAPNSKKKTQVWVVSGDGGSSLLGVVKWFARWRRYAYFPLGECVYEECCLREIAMFIEQRTKEHKEGI